MGAILRFSVRLLVLDGLCSYPKTPQLPGYVTLGELIDLWGRQLPNRDDNVKWPSGGDQMS